MSPVAVCDVGIFFEEERDLFVGVQPYPLGYQHGPVLVAAQLDVVGCLEQLLGHLQQHLGLRSAPLVQGKLGGELRLSLERGKEENTRQ